MKKSLLIISALMVLMLCGVSMRVLLLPGESKHAGRQDDPIRDRLKLHAREAKLKGLTQVDLPLPHAEYVSNIKSLKGTLEYYTLMVATPVKKTTVPANYGMIRTWYVFEINESLTPRRYTPCPECAPSGLLPADLLPINPDQILLAERGGSVTIDGVRLDMRPEFEYDLYEPYLLFVEEDESGMFGRIMVGPHAIFKVAADQTLIPITDHPHTLKDIVKGQYKDSLKLIRSAVKQQK